MMASSRTTEYAKFSGIISTESAAQQFIEQALNQDASTLLSRSSQTVLLQKQLAECILGAELKVHMRTMPQSGGEVQWGNYRNGSTPKNVLTSAGMLELAIPRVRYATFEPKLIPRYQRRLPGFNDSILALYAQGMTYREIGAKLRTLYGEMEWASLGNTVTSDVVAHCRQWQSRELDTTIKVAYFGVLPIASKDEQTEPGALYFGLGLDSDGSRDVLGFWINREEDGAIWPRIMRDLRDRGLYNIHTIATAPSDGLEPAARQAYPAAHFV